MTISATIDRSYKPKTPRRFLVGKVREESPAADKRHDIMTFAYPAEDYDLPALARAVLEAKTDSCRMVFGEGPTFRFCGRRAAVAAGGRLTYCAHCAVRMYQPTFKPAAHRSAGPS